MSRLVDMSGLRFGRLVVLERAANIGKQTAWRCRCDCGAEHHASGPNLRKGNVRSCGCWSSELKSLRVTTHGHRNSPGEASPEYNSWSSMVQRCVNPKATSYPRYGGRGVTVCERWRSFELFLADVGARPDGTSLDRVDNSRGYEPGNTRWATIREQNRNRRDNIHLTYQGSTKTVAEWAQALSLTDKAIYARVARGLSGCEALFGEPRASNCDRSSPDCQGDGD